MNLRITSNTFIKTRQHGPAWRYFQNNIYLYLLLVLPLIYFLIFKYGPIMGILLAFRKYSPGSSIFGYDWVGLRYFKMFLGNETFWNAFKNNIILSVANIVIFFPVPIIFALLLNELNTKFFKKIVQTVSYFPHFISVVVVVGMLKEILSPSSGAINAIIKQLGFNPIYFINEPDWFRTIYIGSGIWQNTGWSAIIYLAVLSSIDLAQYEAAMIDGAGRWKQTLHITIPGIASVVAINLILTVGSMLTIGYEKILLLYTPNTFSTADVISTFVYRVGLEQSNYSFATAVGLFEGIVGVFLVLSTNYLAKKISDTSLF